MFSAALPEDEPARLQALHSYCVLDTPAEPAFDRLARVAAHVFAAPIALVSLVDAERQWFKSRIGLAATETPRDISFCGHVVHDGHRLVVPDAFADPRFADNPLVTGAPGVRFYAGAPLVGSAGHVLGTLCVIDRVARPEPSAEQLDMLQMLADSVVTALELRLQAQRQSDRAALSQLCSEAAALAHGACELGAALPLVLDALCRYAGAREGQAWLRQDPDDDTLQPACGWPAAAAAAAPIDAPGDAAGDWPARVMRAERAIVIHALHPTDGPRVADWHAAGLRHALCLAVWAGGRVQGLIGCGAVALARSDDDLTAAADFVSAQLQCLAERAIAERMKDEFVATVSHELRTPLTSIAGMLGLLELGRAGPLGPKAAQMIQVAHRNSLRLSRLVNDILDIGKLNAGALTLDLQAQPLAPLVERALAEAQGMAQPLGVRFEFTDRAADARVRVDADRAIQVVTNLLSNAAKFSPKGGCVQVGLERLHTRLRLTVADRGPGIPEHFRERIFGRFAQADGLQGRQAQGSGLGLAIVRHLVTAMGGEVGFRTEEGRGTTFHVELPLCAAELPVS